MAAKPLNPFKRFGGVNLSFEHLHLKTVKSAHTMLLKMRQERLGGGCVVIQDDSLISIHARGGYLLNRMKLSTWSLLMLFITGFLIRESLNLKYSMKQISYDSYLPSLCEHDTT